MSERDPMKDDSNDRRQQPTDDDSIEKLLKSEAAAFPNSLARPGALQTSVEQIARRAEELTDADLPVEEHVLAHGWMPADMRRHPMRRWTIGLAAAALILVALGVWYAGGNGPGEVLEKLIALRLQNFTRSTEVWNHNVFQSEE